MTRVPLQSAILLSLVCLYGLTLAAFNPAGFPENRDQVGRLPWLIDKPIGEDGFYMLSVARSMAQGHGMATAEGRPTTGIQPLATFVYAGVYWVNDRLGGDDWSALRLVLGFCVLNFVLFAHVVGRVVAGIIPNEWGSLSAAQGYGVTVALCLLSFSLFRHFTYALETGIYLTLFASTVWASLRLGTGTSRWRAVVLLGVAAGLTAEARIDFGVIFAIFVAAAVVRKHLRFREAIVCGLLSFAILSPWLAYVYLTTGHFLPSSGPAQSKLIGATNVGERGLEMFSAVSGHLAPWLFASGMGWKLPLAACISAFVLVGWALFEAPTRRSLVEMKFSATTERHTRHHESHEGALDRPAAISILICWFVGVGSLIPIYLTFFWATHFYGRYLAPLGCLVLITFGVLLCAKARTASAKMLPLMTLVLLVLFVGQAVLSLHSGRMNNVHTVTAGYILRNHPRERVGCFQSGVIGYFAPNVVNLDGKVNSEALQATKSGQLPKYIDGAGISVLIDWPEYLGTLPAEYLEREWRRYEVDVPNGKSICYVRRRSPP